jgi:2-polyprenyl-3-methyl-5-hydroxy-6-metoxy-1,4-benzoquinol methylase
MQYERPLSTHPKSEDQLLLALAAGAEHVLELGCHTGYFSQALKQRGADVLAVDIDAEAVAVAHARGINAHVSDLNQPGTIASLGRDFDLVVMANVLEHLYRPDTVLRDVIPVVRPSGRILVSVPNVAHFTVRRMLMRGRFEYASSGILDRTHLHFFTRDTLRRLLADSGWQIMRECSSPGELAPGAKALAIELAARWLPTLTAVHLIAEARPPY